MTRLLAYLFATLGLGGAAKGSEPSANPAVMGLRAQALSVKPNDIGLSVDSYSEKPWGVLMEAGLEGRGAYTLVALEDGTVSL